MASQVQEMLTGLMIYVGGFAALGCVAVWLLHRVGR